MIQPVAHLSLALLGPIQGILAGQPITPFKYDKVGALLVYLAVEADRAHEREALMGLFWPDLPEEAARNNLRQALVKLRDAIGDRTAAPPFLLTSRAMLQFDRASDYQVDVAVFSALLDDCDHHVHRHPESCKTCAQQLQQAVALYQGPFLAEFFLPDSAAFEEWALVKREGLHRRMVDALGRLVRYHERCSHYSQALLYAQRQLTLEPWAEEVHRQLMRLHLLNGDRNAALAQYESCRRVLAAELAVPPEAATVALYTQIRNADNQPSLALDRLALPTTRPHALPVQLTPFLGRKPELAELSRLLDRPECRLLTITGPGGIGKTRLALQVAAAHVDDFADGVFFVPLAGVTVAHFLPHAILAALGVPLQAPQPADEQLRTLLQKQEMLLVLDNYEQLLPDVTLLLEILRAAPAVVLLVTARERLALQAEWLFTLDGLSYPQPSVEERVDEYAAVELFMQRAHQAQNGFNPTDAERQAVDRICQLVEGMPLGIELAAVWASSLSCREIAQEIERNIDFLTVAQCDLPPRHRSLRAIFDYSWQRLTQAEQQVMCQLSVFGGAFRREAAVAVTGASLAMLAELMAKSLLRRNVQGCYDLHEVVRQYAALQLAEDSAIAAKTAERHGHYYLHWFAQQDQGLKGAGQAESLAEVNRAIDNLRLAWRWATTQCRAAAVGPALPAFWLYYEYRRIFDEPIAMLQEGVDHFEPAAATDEASLITLARLLGLLGYFHLRVGNLSAARRELTRSLTLLRPFPATKARGDVLLQAGVVFHTSGEFDSGITLLQEALDIQQQHNDWWMMGACYYFLGNAKLIEGKFGESVDYLTRSLHVVRTSGNRFMQAGLLAFLSAATLGTSQPTQARQIAEDALRLAQETDDGWSIAQALNVLGLVANGEQNYQDACRLLAKSAALYEQLGEAWSLSRVTFNWGKTLLAAGEEQAAQRILLRSLQIAHAAQVLPTVLDVLITLASAATRTTTTNDSYRWAALVAHHPASTAEARRQAEGLCRALQPSLFPQILQTPVDPQQASTLDDIVMALLVQAPETDAAYSSA